MKKSINIIATLTAITIFGIIYIQSSDFLYEREKFEAEIINKANNLRTSLQVKDNNIKSPDNPDMAAFDEYVKTFDPATGNVPKKRLFAAYNKTKKMQKEQLSSLRNREVMNWETSGSNMGGRTRAIMFDPNDTTNKKVWAGGVTGGLWYVNDINDLEEDWTPVNDFWSNLAVSCITYDPNNPQIMYVGTGEAQTARIIYRASSGVGAGIFKTTDGGQSWELINSTSEFSYVTDIAVRDESGTSVIYACVASGVYEGEDHTSEPTDGLYRSTDGGLTWTQVLPVIPESNNKPYAPADIEINANGRIFIGTMENLDKQGGATILYSDSGLEGSWTTYGTYNTIISNEPYYNVPARTLVASSASDPNTIYAQFAAGYVGNYGFTYYRGRYMVVSTDEGTTWESINIPDSDWSTLAWHAFVLKVDPTDPNTIYTGGLDLWKTSDVGASWRRISDWSLMYSGGGDDYVHADQHSIQFQPGNPNTAIFSNDGGVFLTNSANLVYPNFIERNQGLSTLQFYTAAIKPTSFSKHYMGGLQDNGTLLHKGQPLSIMDMIDGGDGAYCFWDQNQANITITSSYYNRYTFYSNENPVSYFNDNSGTFISPADYDYKENILYSNAVSFTGGNSNKILKATDIPTNVNRSKITLATNSLVPFSHITYSNYSPEGSSILFIGTQSGRLFKVIDANANPTTVEIGTSDFPFANISCVAIGNSDDELLVTFSNYGVPSVWLTMDGGTNWVEKESNLPDMPIRWAIFHPENNGQALLATEIGVWSTNTLQEEETIWEPDVNGLANVRVDMLKIRLSDNVVLAATHGRGLFTSPYPLDIYTDFEENKELSGSSFSVYPNPATDYLTISNKDRLKNLQVRIIDLNGKVVLSKTYLESTIKIDVQNIKTGTYLVEIVASNKHEKHKIVIN